MRISALPFWLFAVLLAVTACGSETTPTEPAPIETPAPAAAPDPTDNPYPPIPIEQLVYLYNNATYMDATFYNLPVSINQSERAQIQTSITNITENAATIYPECAQRQPFGHLWFQVNGENVEEADIYFGGNCTYYLWYKDGKPFYSNQLSEQGIAFYNNILRSVQQQ